MKKIAHCLPLFLIIAFGIVSAQSYQVAIPKDKSTIVDTKGKDPSASAIKIVPRIRDNYESAFSRSTADTERPICGTMPFFEGRHEPQRSCSFYGAADEPEVRDSYIPDGVTPFKTVRLYIHAFIDGNGDTTASQSDVEAQMYTLNEEFAPHKISFEALYDVHYDSEYDSISSWGYYLKEAYAVSPSEYHNVFVTDLDGYLGVSTFPWDSDALNIYGGTLMDRFWFGGPRYFEGEYDVPQRTLTHELGHALGLWHTHHGVDEVAECGSCYEGAEGYSYSGDDNPDVVGDLCSDTKSTPTNYSCYDPSGTDCQGNNWVDTDVHNYMGYASDLCYNQNGEGFSSQQSGRMHAWVDEALESQVVSQDPPPAIFFSEWSEGTSNNKYLEIYNGTNDEIDLRDFAFPTVANSPNVPGEYEYWNTFDSSATIAPGDVFVITRSNADSLILQEADMFFQYLSNGDDGVCLVQGSEDDYVVIDCIGDWYGDPGSGWDVAGVPEATRDHTLIRKSSVEYGNPDWSSSAGTDEEDSEWIVMEQNYWEGLGSHPSGPVEEVNYSLRFDGVDDYVLVGDNQSLDQVSEEFTISASVKFSEIGDQGYILSKRYYSAGPGYEIRVANNLLYVEVNPGGGAITLTTPIENDDQFHTIITTFKNQDHFRLYLDDQLVNDFGVDATIGTNTSFSIPSLTNDENLVIGDFSAMDGRTFHGIIDDLSIYSESDYSLSGNLIAHWNFNEGEGTILTDLSGNGNDGAIHGATWSEEVPIPPVLGCVDPYAENYNPEATVDDGSCSGYPDNENYSLSFDGEDDYVRIPLSSSLNLNDFDTLSIAASFKINSFDHEMGLVSFGGTGDGITIAINGGQLMSWFPGYTVGDRTEILSTDVWYDVIVTYITGETGSKKIYINGELQVDEFYSYPFYPNQNTSAYLGIGDEFNGYEGRYLDGLVDNVAIFNRELGDTEIELSEFDQDGLISNWKFGSGEGNILYDHSGNQNHGTIYGADWILSGCTDPYAENYDSNATEDDGSCHGYPDNGNYSLSFDSDNVSVGEIGDYSSKVTVMGWVKTTDGGSYHAIVSGSCGNIMLTMHEGKLLFGSQCSTPIQHDTYGITELNDGEWHHVAATYDENGGDNNLRVYVDGVLEGQSTKTGQFVTGDFTIASSPAPGEYFDGNIDMLRIWDIALSEEQIFESMYNEFPIEDSHLLADWRFNDGEGDILFDHSGNSNHGEINGASWDEEGYETPKVAVTFSVNMNDYVEETGDSLEDHGGIYIAGGNIGAENPEDSLFMGHRMYDFDANNIYEVTLQLEKNTEYVYKYRIGPAEEDWSGNWEEYLDDCGTGPWGDRYFTTDLSDSMSVGPFCWNSCENCALPNRSLSFDGVDDYVSIADDDSLTSTSAMTISAWFKKVSGAGWMSIVGKGTSDVNEEYVLMLKDDQVYFDVGQGGGPYLQQSTTIAPETWHHIAAVHTRSGNTSTLKVFLNGEDVGGTTVGASYTPNDNSYPLTIGSRWFSGSYGLFQGQIDDVRIWNNALDGQQIQENMYNNPSGYEDGLVGYWNFNDGEGSTLTDLSGNGNHGTIYGATWSDDVMQPLYTGPEWYVSTEGSDDNNGSYEYPFASIQHAVDAANDYDLVEISPGEYFENVVINQTLQIGGNYEEGDIIVNGQQSGSVFHVEGLEDTIAVHLFGLRIQNGRSEKGAGVYVTNGLVQIVESWVQNNQTAGQGSQGGGVYAYNARLEISDSDIVDNYADDLPGFGAGIYADSSELHIGGSYISHNSSSSGSGGGIYITNNSNSHIFSSNVMHNNALKQGGGIFLSNGSSFYADEDVRVNNNMVMQDCFTGQGSQGAGFYIDNSAVWYANGYIWANKSFDSGGAFFITNGSTVSFSNLAMDTNESAEIGGGENTIGGALGLVFDSELSLDHCTIYGNNSISGGVSGLYSSNSTVDIRSSIFWNNPGQWDGESGQLIGSSFDVSYSDIQGGYEGSGNVDMDPLFCNLSYFELAENSPLLGLGQDGTDIGAAGIGCDPIYNSEIQFVDISVSGNSAQFSIMTDGDHDHFHWNVDYGETFMSVHSTSVYGLDPGLHRFAAYLVDSTHQTISNVFIKHFLIQDGVDVYLSENFDAGDSTLLPGWGLSSNNEYGWEVNSQNFPGSNPNGWNVPQGSGNFIFAQDYNDGFDASEDYLILPPQNFSSIENPVALEFYSFFTGSRVYSDGFNFGKISSGEEYDQSNYNSMIIEYGGDTVEDPFFIESIPFNATGTIIGYTNDYDEECDQGTSTSPDVVYSFTPDYDMVVDVDLCSEETFYDTKVFVYENSAGHLANTLNGTGACNDDYCSNSHQSYLSFISGVTLFAGNTYYFVVDGWNGEFGDYDLNIYEHQSESDQTAHIEISTDGGENWEEIYQVAPTEYNAWEPVYVDLSDFSNESDLLIAFHSNDQGSNGTGWAVDDITLLSAYQEEEGFIIGSVYSEETGGPLSDVYVEAVSEDSSVYNWAITDSSGFFEVGVIGNKNYFFRASNEYGEYIDYFYVGGNETYDLGEIFIGDNTTSFVEGWVSNWYTGQPLGGSNVLLVYEHDGTTHTIEESTAPDGYFMVQVPADNNFDMFIYADGYWAEHDAFYLSAGDNHTLGIGIAPLNMAARIYGSVTDQYSGEMIHGAEAILNCGTSEDWDHTGALGSYRVFSYYPSECNDGTLIVRAGGYLTQYHSAGDLNFQPGQSITMNIELEEGNDPDPGIILGRVHAANNGDGIPHALISAYAYTSGGSYGVEADESGYYFMSELIGDQEYEVMVSAEGYTTVMETHYLGSGDSLYLDFYLEDAPRSGMFGFVQNNDGEPISEVNIYPTLNGNDYFWASTDDSGYYHVELPAGTYFVSTGVNNYYVSSVSDLEILPEQMVEVNFTLEAIESFDGGAAGIVYSGVGQTASGINVNFWNTDLYDATTITNENGAYAIDLINGTYNVSVWGGGFDDVFIPGVTINNNIIPLDIYLFDNNSPQPPVIVQLEDVPNDQGGQMDMVWSPGIPMEWEIFPYYSVWRENEDSWHFISMVPYHDFNVYNMVVPTLGDSTHEGIHWSTFMVTAHTEDLYVFFDSETSTGYSIDNLPPDTPVGLNAEIVEGGVMLNWSAPLDDDFSYHNVYRTDVMSYEPALIFTTIDSFYIDFEIDQSTNYEYWVTAVDHNGNESEASNSVQISPTGLLTDADLLPDAFALNQNYPNPFNPSTQIRYALPEQSQVVLTVYDMLGRKVRTLVNGVQDAGYRTVMWNATSDLGTPVSAGMYIYTIRANEFYEVKKMILLK